MLDARLVECNMYDPTSIVDNTLEEGNHTSNKNLKNSALFFSLAILSIPLIILKYIDNMSRLRISSDSEEVSLNKQLAYQVDVFLSVHPYAKPLALLLATLLLICLGGLALFGVTDDSLADCLWLSWTYVADSGNHANSTGISPKLVSVSISFGGMLIFAMMLGLVSDAISEKFDSLRKGKSEVIEKNHTLILGWSDKLVSFYPVIILFCTPFQLRGAHFMMSQLYVYSRELLTSLGLLVCYIVRRGSILIGLESQLFCYLTDRSTVAAPSLVIMFQVL